MMIRCLRPWSGQQRDLDWRPPHAGAGTAWLDLVFFAHNMPSKHAGREQFKAPLWSCKEVSVKVFFDTILILPSKGRRAGDDRPPTSTRIHAPCPVPNAE